MHWRAQTDVVQDAAAFRTGVVNFTGGTFPEQLRSGQVSADFIKLFGAPIVLGRAFTADEDLPNGPNVAVLGNGTWVTRFNSDREVVGKTISLDGEPYTIVGVLGDFDFAIFGTPQTPQVWTPFQLDPNTADQGHFLQAGARLKPAVTLEQAKAKLTLSAQGYLRRYPNALGPNGSFSVETLKEVLIRNVRRSLFVLVGAVAFVLLIACASVANLLMVRATGRKREIAVRAALGGSRGRIARQLLTESVLLSVVGGALGLGLAGIRALLAVNTAGLPRVGLEGSAVGLDWRVLTFTLAISAGTGLLFGLFPAFQSARTDLTTTLKESSGRSGTGFRQNKARSILVMVEVALALILLVGSALLIRTAIALGGVDPRFDSHNVLTMRMSLTGPRFLTSEGVERVVRDGVARLRNVPGVITASGTCCVPLEGRYGLPFTIVGRPNPTQGPFHGGGQWMTVSPGYFEVFKIPVKRGRTFTDRDNSASERVVIVNEAMAIIGAPSSGTSAIGVRAGAFGMN